MTVFRALAHIGHGPSEARLANGNEFKSFRTLCESLSTELKRSVVLDGEIVCLDGDGKSLFYDLLFRRGQPRFVAFDLLHCDGEDLTYSPLVERKRRLHTILSGVKHSFRSGVAIVAHHHPDEE